MNLFSILLLIFSSKIESRLIPTQCNLDFCEAEIENLKNLEISENQNFGTSECWNLENCIWKLSCGRDEKDKLVEIVLDYCRNSKNLKIPKIVNTNCENLLEKLIEEVEFGDSVDLQLEICDKLENKCSSLTSLQKSRIQKSCKLLEFQKNPISKCFENLKFSKNLQDECLGNIDFFNFARLSICNIDEEKCSSLTSLQKSRIQKSCKLLEFQKNPISKCFENLKFSKNLQDECLGNIDFFDFFNLSICNFDENLKICTRGIIQRECGDEAWRNFELHNSLLFEIYNC